MTDHYYNNSIPCHYPIVVKVHLDTRLQEKAMKKLGRPPVAHPLSGAERSRRWRQRQRERDRESLANIVALLKNRNEKDYEHN